MTALIPTAASNAFACSTASFLASESPTKRTRCGSATLPQLVHRFAFVCILPAVSIRTTSLFLARAFYRVAAATAAGSLPARCLIILTPACPRGASCSIAPARNVSPPPARSRFSGFKRLATAMAAVCLCCSRLRTYHHGARVLRDELVEIEALLR